MLKISYNISPTTSSPTITLLRLHPDHRSTLRASTTASFNRTGLLIHLGANKLSERDGRCVQSPRTNSPRRTDSRLLAIPISRIQVSGYDSYLGRIYSVART